MGQISCGVFRSFPCEIAEKLDLNWWFGQLQVNRHDSHCSLPPKSKNIIVKVWSKKLEEAWFLETVLLLARFFQFNVQIKIMKALENENIETI